MAVLYNAEGGIIRGVKNLGWMLRNWRHITRIQVTPVDPAKHSLAEARLTVYLDPSTAPRRTYRYETLFNSSGLLWDWLQRPTLAGLPLTWGNLPERTIEKGAAYPGQPVN